MATSYTYNTELYLVVPVHVLIQPAVGNTTTLYFPLFSLLTAKDVRNKDLDLAARRITL